MNFRERSVSDMIHIHNTGRGRRNAADLNMAP